MLTDKPSQTANLDNLQFVAEKLGELCQDISH